jgi:hypothetical protein
MPDSCVFSRLRVKRLAESRIASGFPEGGCPWRTLHGAGSSSFLASFGPGIPTRELQAPLRPGTPKNWFHGFIQSSQSLSAEDLGAIHAAFEKALREDVGLDFVSTP